MRDSRQAVARNNKNPNSNTRDVNAAARASLALQLRLQKLSYEEIAQRVGYANKGVCFNAVQRAMNSVIVRDVENLRAEELAILDKLHSEAWELAMDKSNKGRLFAFDRLIELSRDRRKLLNLDLKPEEIAANVTIIREVPVGYLDEVPKGE